MQVIDEDAQLGVARRSSASRVTSDANSTSRRICCVGSASMITPIVVTILAVASAVVQV